MKPKPDPSWIQSLQSRLDQIDCGSGGLPVSIKVRVLGGCFCRGCCRNAWEIIDQAQADLHKRNGRDFYLEEHESGPEIIAFLAIATAGITLTKSLIDLLITIVKARSDGRKNGDQREEPLEIVVRRIQTRDELREEFVLRIGQHDCLDRRELESKLKAALESLVRDREEANKSGIAKGTAEKVKKLKTPKKPKKGI